MRNREKQRETERQRYNLPHHGPLEPYIELVLYTKTFIVKAAALNFSAKQGNCPARRNSWKTLISFSAKKLIVCFSIKRIRKRLVVGK